MKRVIAFFVVMAIVFAVVAAWTPVQGDGWLHWVWAGRHPGGGVGTWLLAHTSSADAFGYLLARYPSVHVMFSPMIAIALVVGLFVVAMGRTPTGEDLLGLSLASALLWIAQPHPGVTWFYTPSTAMHIYGAAAAVWLVAPFRCGWKVPPIGWPGLIALAYCAGTSTRAIALVTLVAMIWIVRWKPVTLVLLAATVLGFARSPYLEIGKVVRRGIDPNLFVLKLPFEEIGKVVALVAVFALIELGRRVYGKVAISDDNRPVARPSLLIGYFAVSVFCIFGPKYYEATLFPATCLLVIAALPWLLWFAQLRGFRIAMIAFAIAVHAIAWGVSLKTYRWIGKEGAARFAMIAKAPEGSSPTVPPYSEILATPWFFGEDFSTTRLRQLVAIDVFKLRDIVVSPAYRRFESNPEIYVAFEQADATTAQLTAARPPAIWSTVPSVAREQFDLFVKRLAATTGRPVTARLVVQNLTFSALHGRPLLLAWAEHGASNSPRAQLSTLDEENQFTLKMSGLDTKMFDEAWWLQGDVVTKTPYRNGSPRVRPTLPVRSAIVLCDDKRCLLLDAFVPHF